MSASVHVHHLPWRAAGCVGHLLETLAFTLFVNPFAILAAGVAAWFLGWSIASMLHFAADGGVWGLVNSLSCGACVTSLSVVTILAAIHIALTALAGWRSVTHT